jgi:hypothetical protein
MKMPAVTGWMSKCDFIAEQLSEMFRSATSLAVGNNWDNCSTQNWNDEKNRKPAEEPPL